MFKSTLLTICCATVLLCSCSQEPTYSCDKTIDNWVKENINDIQTMSRDEWLNTTEALAIPIYRAFTPEQRVSFWQVKMEEIKQLPLNDAEIAHIDELISFINNHTSFFSDDGLNDSQLNTLEIFAYTWAQKSIKTLGWSESFVNSIIASGNKVLNKNGEIKPFANTKGAQLLAAGEVCHCNQTFDFCGSGEECTENSCDVSAYGCGIMLLNECNGYCIPDWKIKPKY